MDVLNASVKANLTVEEREEECDVCEAMQELADRAAAEGREEGRVKGREEGREEGRAEGRAEGHAEGREEGRAEGRVEGREEGRTEAARETCVKLYKKGWSAEDISDLLNYSADTVREWLLTK